ncbi:MAG: ketopantoate reductase family protein [Bacilli bacterium]
MKIGVFGGGSIGLLIAAHCAKQHDVTVYVRTMEQKNMLQEGLYIESPSGEEIFQIKAELSEQLQQCDVLFVCVKSYATKQIVKDYPIFERAKTVCFVQNGMLAYETFKDTSKQVLFGTMTHGVWRRTPNRIVHAGLGTLTLSTVGSVADEAETLYKCYKEDPTFPVLLSTNARRTLLQKLIVNALINPLTAKYQVKNGELLYDAHLRLMMDDLYKELVCVFPEVKTWGALELVMDVCEKTAENYSSMYNDIVVHKRESEIDSILGVIIRQAESQQIPVPLFRKLYDELKGERL